MSKLRRLWDLVCVSCRLFQLYEIIRDHFDDLV